MISGIYGIVSQKSSGVYIGSSQDIKMRWQQHRSLLLRGKHYNPHLQNAWNKYGKEFFIFEIFEKVEDLANLIDRENFWLQYFGKSRSLYNLYPVGGSPRGYRHTEETREKCRKRMKGNTHLLGHRHTAETKKRMSKSQLNRGPRSIETRRKISQSLSGRKFSQEAIEKMRKAATGRRHSKEARAKMSKARKGRSFSEEHKTNMGKAFAKPYPAFKNRDTGEIIPSGINLSARCKERGLRQQHMWKVMHGQRKHHRGWMLLEEK